MKKLSCALLAAVAIAAIGEVDAKFVGPNSETMTTVEQAKKMADDSHVVLKGNIEKSLGDEKYVFKDTTGSIVVEIDDDDWGGIDASPKDTLEISGEVDTHMMKPTEIDVDSIKLIK